MMFPLHIRRANQLGGVIDWVLKVTEWGCPRPNMRNVNGADTGMLVVKIWFVIQFVKIKKP